MSVGSPLVFIKSLTSAFFNNIIETCREFEKAFKTMSSLPSNAGNNASGGHSSLDSQGVSSSQPNSLTDMMMNGNESRTPTSFFPSSYPEACLLVWCQKEVTDFVNRFSKHVFLPSVPVSVACESVSILRNQGNRLRNALGLDLLFYLDKLLKEELEKTIKESKSKLMESMSSKFQEETWQSVNLISIPGVDKFLSEVKESSPLHPILKSYIYDEHKVSLASCITFFAKSYLTLTIDWMKLSTPFTHRLVLQSLLEVIKPVIDFMETSLRNDKHRKDVKFIRRNATFLLDQLIPLVDQVYVDKTGGHFKELTFLRIDYEYLKGETRGGKEGDASSKSGHNQNNSSSRRPSNGPVTHSTTTSSSPEKKRTPSKSTVSITEGGKIVSTTTYL